MKAKKEPKKRVFFASATNPNEDELEAFVDFVVSLAPEDDELEEEGKEKDTEEDKKKNNIGRSGDGRSPCGSVD